MYTERIGMGFAKARDALARALITLKVSPNALTLLGLVATAAAGVFVAQGRLRLAVAALLVSGALDMLDGAVAKLGRSATGFGGVFDSTVDRYSDFAIFFGCVWLYRADFLMVTVTLFALLGALLTSYVRARAETVIDECRAGFFERGERFVFIMIGLFFHHLPTVLWTLAILSNLAALQRLAATALALKEKARDVSLQSRSLAIRFLIWDYPRRGLVYDVAVAFFVVLAAVGIPPLDAMFG